MAFGSVLVLRIELSAEPGKAAFGPADGEHYEDQERGRRDGCQGVAEADGDADRGQRPDQGGGRDALDPAVMGEDHAGAEEPHARHDTRHDPTDAGGVVGGDISERHEERACERHDDADAQARRAAPQLTVEPDRAAAEDRGKDIDHHLVKDRPEEVV